MSFAKAVDFWLQVAKLGWVGRLCHPTVPNITQIFVKASLGFANSVCSRFSECLFKHSFPAKITKLVAFIWEKKTMGIPGLYTMPIFVMSWLPRSFSALILYWFSSPIIQMYGNLWKLDSLIWLSRASAHSPMHARMGFQSQWGPRLRTTQKVPRSVCVKT